ncbi:helix-turn-helix transcriptional regulator [Kribbella sp. NPDC051952]|uniref:helix-turn-helix transcriptional regulator n=1 Tax=Kribbella sp. NPDC051952 TaxID=3154851 RepID=UPI003432B95B
MSRYAGRQRELGAFLRERRGRLTPTGDDAPRRTPGLRRAEIAELAGLSTGYYTRLEQGHAAHPSESVLESLIRTLQLTPDEAAHLKALAARPPALPPEEVSESALRMITLLAPPTAAVVLGRIGDVLAWNEPARILFPGRFPARDEHLDRQPASDAHPGQLQATGRRPNNARYVFCDPRARDLFADWPQVADDTVAHLRAAAGHLVDDPDYRALVDELLAASPEFAARWPRRDVKRHVSGHKRFHHPTLGDLTLPYEVLAVLDAPDQYLVVYGLTTEKNLVGDVEIPGSVSTS